MLSRLRSLLLRLAGGRELRPADGVVAAALVLIPLMAVFGAIHYYGITHPEVVPFIDHDWLKLMFKAQSGFFLPGAVGFLVAGLLARRYWPESQLLPHGIAQFVVLGLAWGSYSNGHYTDLFGAMGLFTITVLGLLVFNAQIVWAGILSFVVLVLATTIAEQMGIIPYAPVFAGPPLDGGHLATSWLLGRGGFSFLILLAAALFFIAVMQRFRTTYEALSLSQEKLERSNRIIRRYVPAQLAEKILTGEHTGTALPERRKVTLFFSDVVGFTEAADQMEAENLSALLNEYLSEMAQIAEAHGATINQFVGDGIMIFFGAPEATTDRDHALRAVRMALAMQQRMGELREKWFAEGIQTPFRIRIGINTGVASVGDFGSEGRTTYSAIGNQTNLTARIQEACEPGTVWISHTTWALVRDEIPCQERGEIEVKGLHYPVRVYEVENGASSASGAV